MNSLFDLVTQQLGGSNLGQISRQIGADESTTQSAIGMALPVLIGALARNASQPAGAAAIDRALENHDGSVLDDLGSLLGGGVNARAGAGILGHVLGGKRAPVEQGIGRATGLSPQQVGKLLIVLAPIVMAALSRMRQQHAADAADPGVGAVLQREQQEVARRAPEAGGLAGMLDRNDDGSIVDDLARMAPGMLGGLFGGAGGRA
jgi:hypothetical protein